MERRSIYAELWTSFVALIRSYVAGHDLAQPVSNHALVDEGEAGHLTLRGERKTLDLEFDAATGGGSWAVYEDDPGTERVLTRGRFEIDEDSHVALSDGAGKLEMEVAAEAFTAKVFD
ncbi:MAG TPA: hypothetical protein VFW25_05640 [Silvibacterium sp.]|nr:hypothetical protein [Silvibacterium sp.]